MSKATAQDVFKAFQQYRDWTKLEIFSDESGAVRKAYGDENVFCFNNFDEALTKLAAPQPGVGDLVAQGPYLFAVTNICPSNVRADRARYGDKDYIIFVPLAKLRLRPNTRTWEIA